MRTIEAEQADVIWGQPALAEGTDTFVKKLHVVIIISRLYGFNNQLGRMVGLYSVKT
jgi:hypothetical protein